MTMRITSAILCIAAATICICPAVRADGAADVARTSLGKYFKAWNENDPGQRQKLLATAWTDDATYTDPTAHVEGRDALVAHVGGFLANPQMKGFSIVQASEIDFHHRVFRFEWEMKDPQGNLVTKGFDYGEFNDAGAITKIVGFFGPFPALK